jgi:hypothetical protein
VGKEAAMSIWGNYPNYQDIARLEYGRLLWKSAAKSRLLAHWTNPGHPYAERFRSKRYLVERILESSLPNDQLDKQLQAEGYSLRSLMREIPPVFGSI